MMAVAGGSLFKGSILVSSTTTTTNTMLALRQYQPLLFPPIPYPTATTTASCCSTRSTTRLGSFSSNNTTTHADAAAAAFPSSARPFSYRISSHPNYSYVHGTTNPICKKGTAFILSRNTTKTLGLGLECFCTTGTGSTTSAPQAEAEAEHEQQVVVNLDDDVATLTKIKDAANTLDIRVGKILLAWRHPEADSLYVEEVDVGEAEPRIICSGLVNYVPLHQLQDMNVVVLANLKPRNMRGVKSFGMLMAASDASHENVELLVPPEGSVPGERIWFGSVEERGNLPDAASPNQIQKKKIWEMVQPHLKTYDSCIGALGLHTMRTARGVVVSRSLKNARIS